MGARGRIRTFALWAAASAGIGLACGAGAVLLSALVEAAFAANQAAGWLACALPVCGVATVALYRAGKVPFDFGTVDVVARMRQRGAIPFALAPLIMAGTALTTLGGGSVGKEAAALQLGGAVASRIARTRREFDDAHGVLIAAGMAAAFSALMFAPLAATCFVLELSRFSRPRLLRWRTLCIPAAALVAFALANAFGVGRLWAGSAALPAFPNLLFESAVVGAMAALAGMAFCALLKLAHTASVTFVKSPWARMLVGGAAVAVLVQATGGAYGGTGAAQIAQATAGEALPYSAFAWKFLVTVACLGFGFKGGEIMPVLSLGACLGCAFAQMMGADTAFLSCVGMVALFGACSGCPVAAVVLGAEAFGWAGLAWYAVAVLLACAFTRRFSLYDTHTWTLDVAWASTVEHLKDDVDLVRGRPGAD